MSNVIKLRADGDDNLQVRRAQHLRDLLKAERWSINQAAAKIHMPKTTLAERLRGATPLLFDDIEKLAPLVRKTPESLYIELLRLEPGRDEPQASTVKSGRLATITPLFAKSA